MISDEKRLEGRELTLPAGPRDQTPLLDRDDVLVFQTEPMDRAFKVVGDVTTTLWVSSDCPDTDFTVRLTDVYPDGRSMRVLDGVLKARYHESMTEVNFLEPGEVVPIMVDLGATAISFDKGHRIQILVSSSNYRRFEASKNNDDDIWGDAPARVAHNQVHVDKIYASYLMLPELKSGVTRAATPISVQVPSAPRKPSTAKMTKKSE